MRLRHHRARDVSHFDHEFLESPVPDGAWRVIRHLVIRFSVRRNGINDALCGF